MKTKLYIFDEVNCAFTDLKEKHIDEIIKRTKLLVKGAHMTAAFKLKLTDGKESNFFDNGSTYFYMLDKVIPMVCEFGYEVEIEDHRTSLQKTYNHIDENFLNEYGYILHDFQVTSANEVIDNNKGIIEVSTSGGKSIISATIIKIFEQELDFITIVPSETLVKQMYATYSEIGLDIGHLTKGMTKKKREEAWAHKHIVCTWQLLKNNKDRLKRFGGFIYDEAHIMGDVMFSILGDELSHALIRVGMTATLPTKDKLKKEKILCRIGNGSLITVAPKELQDKKIISTCDIDMYAINHYFDEIEYWDWDLEEEYLLKNKTRLKTIADFINNLKSANTLILCFKQMAIALSQATGLDYIHGDVKEKIRQEHYKKFKDNNSYDLIATYDTVGTGLSINEIERLILIDAGKNDIRIIQGIGRGLRKDGKDDHLKVIDLYSRIYAYNNKTSRYREISYSGSKHVGERKKFYKKLHYPFIEMDDIIIKNNK